MSTDEFFGTTPLKRALAIQSWIAEIANGVDVELSHHNSVYELNATVEADGSHIFIVHVWGTELRYGFTCLPNGMNVVSYDDLVTLIIDELIIHKSHGRISLSV